MAVFVLGKNKKPLMPCSEKRARLLLKKGRAVVHKRYPFTIRLKDREGGQISPLRLCIDPGSRHTGLAVVRESRNERYVLCLFEIIHRGLQIRNSLSQRCAFRRRRRGANLRYRKPRFNNRARRQGWLPPSLQHRVDNITAWSDRLRRLAPVDFVTQELVRFDTQKMDNPEITGVEYQQGTLLGYEVREYLLEKWGRECAYCGDKNTPLEIEHIKPRCIGGSDRVSNLTVACHECNQSKGGGAIEAFFRTDKALSKRLKANGYSSETRLLRILRQRNLPLADASAVNSTRWALYRALKSSGISISVGSGGCTKFNRQRLGIPKTHALDAACVGEMDALQEWRRPTLIIKAMGRGGYKRTRLNKHGFPRGYLMQEKRSKGFQTGDMVRAEVLSGKNAGVHVGRVAIRRTGKFNVQVASEVIQGISYRHCTLLQRGDGYRYHQVPSINQLGEGMQAA